MSECTVIESTIICHARERKKHTHTQKKTMPEDRSGKESKEKSDVQGEVSREIV